MKKFILDHRLTLTNLSPTTKRHLKKRLTIQNPKYRETEKAGRYTGGNVPGGLMERITEAMMRTSKLLHMRVLDQLKAHARMQKHAMRRGVFVTLDGGRQIKAHEDMVKPDTGNRFKPHEGLTKPNMGMGG